MAGIRHVTGSDDPARKGNFIDLDRSTISFAHSHFQERCLSLKTGTARPSFCYFLIVPFTTSINVLILCETSAPAPRKAAVLVWMVPIFA